MPVQPAPPDPHALSRFLDAQAPVYATVVDELRAGRKRSHWMWFVFPQHVGLGRSATAQHYGLASLEAAGAYEAHPVLGSRLRECCALLLALPGRDAHAVFGSPDDLKLRSSMTLFAQAAPQTPCFAAVLARYCGAEPDPLTLALLGLPATPAGGPAPRS